MAGSSGPDLEHAPLRLTLAATMSASDRRELNLALSYSYAQSILQMTARRSVCRQIGFTADLTTVAGDRTSRLRKETDMDAKVEDSVEGQCPMGRGAGGRTRREWWPDNLRLDGLNQHAPRSTMPRLSRASIWTL